LTEFSFLIVFNMNYDLIHYFSLTRSRNFSILAPAPAPQYLLDTHAPLAAIFTNCVSFLTVYLPFPFLSISPCRLVHIFPRMTRAILFYFLLVHLTVAVQAEFGVMYREGCRETSCRQYGNHW
jgi:hypothetical protein